MLLWNDSVIIKLKYLKGYILYVLLVNFKSKICEITNFRLEKFVSLIIPNFNIII